MSRASRAICCLALLLAVAGCSPSPETARRQVFALGTLVDITLYPAPADAADHFGAVEAQLRLQEQRWRAWPGPDGDDAGELLAVNRAIAAGEAFALPASLQDGFATARELQVQSGGRFNPAIGKLVALWQFHVDDRPDSAPPAPADIEALVAAQPGLADIQPAGDGLWRATNPAVYIDMGAFAKGLAVDAAIDTLHENGIGNAIVNAGGDLVTLGRHGDRDWRIGIRKPRGEGVLAALEISGRQAVFTSGDYERKFEFNGQRYHHILDPASGYPARGSRSVTVVHENAATADAAATALFVAGDDWPLVAAAMQVDKVMRVAADGRIEMTAAMREIASFPDGAPENVEVLQ